MHLADVAAREGDSARAKSLHRECLDIRQSLHDMAGVAISMERLAAVIGDEAPTVAVHLLGSAQRLREQIKTAQPPAARDETERLTGALVGLIGAEAFGSALAEGRRLTADSALEEAFGIEAKSLPSPA
jgi:hypothetical protein